MKENEMMQEVQGKKLNKKGFSLVELIVVIAIMAILIGIVGTQVLPYIEKSRQAKDNQVVSGVLTAAATTFASKAAQLPATGTVTIDLFGSETDALELAIQKQIQELVNYTTLASFQNAMESKVGKAVGGFTIVYSASTGFVTVTTTGVSGNSNWKAGVFDPISSK